jgi:hypothetical protein
MNQRAQLYMDMGVVCFGLRLYVCTYESIVDWRIDLGRSGSSSSEQLGIQLLDSDLSLGV